MDMKRYSDRDHIPGSVAKSTPDHWILFIAEGGSGLLVVPCIGSAGDIRRCGADREQVGGTCMAAYWDGPFTTPGRRG